MKLSDKEVEVVEILTGSEGVEYDVAVEIAKSTDGDMMKAKNAAIMLRRGWTLIEVLDSLKRR